MTDQELKDFTVQGYYMICVWSRNIAMLPLEDWLEGLNRAEAVGQIVDPTAYREGAEKVKLLKQLIEAAIPLKAVVQKAQKTLTEEN